MTAFTHGPGPEADQQSLLCELLGLDPAETTEIRIHIEAGDTPVVEWQGRRRVPIATVIAAFEQRNHDGPA